MAINLTQAKKLLNATELGLFDASRTVNVKSVGAADLQRKIKRVRTLRDKARDLLQRQKLATRQRTGSKLGKSGVANVRTAQKEAVFSEMLGRLEARAKQLDDAQQREATKGTQPATALKKKRAATDSKAAEVPAKAPKVGRTQDKRDSRA